MRGYVSTLGGSCVMVAVVCTDKGMDNSAFWFDSDNV